MTIETLSLIRRLLEAEIEAANADCKKQERLFFAKFPMEIVATPEAAEFLKCPPEVGEQKELADAVRAAWERRTTAKSALLDFLEHKWS